MLSCFNLLPMRFHTEVLHLRVWQHCLASQWQRRDQWHSNHDNPVVDVIFKCGVAAIPADANANISPSAHQTQAWPRESLSQEQAELSVQYPDPVFEARFEQPGQTKPLSVSCGAVSRKLRSTSLHRVQCPERREGRPLPALAVFRIPGLWRWCKARSSEQGGADSWQSRQWTEHDICDAAVWCVAVDFAFFRFCDYG